MPKIQSVYFAHPMSLYHTLTERVIIEAMRRRGYEVINPSDDIFQREYRASLETEKGVHPMRYWLELAGRCDVCVFTPFPREHVLHHLPHSNRQSVSAGVVKEVNHLHTLKRRIEWVVPDAKAPEDVAFHAFLGWRDFKRLSVSATKKILRAQGVVLE